MTPQTLRQTLESLRLEPTAAANVLGVHKTTMYRWLSGNLPIPEIAARFLTYMDKGTILIPPARR